MKTRNAILGLLCLVILVAGARVLYWTHLPKWQARNSPIKWTQKLPDALSGTPALGKDGTIYVTTRGGAVYALDRSGAIEWAYRADQYDLPSGLVLDGDDNLYFFTLRKAFSLTALGKKRWEVECSPAKTFRPMQASALAQGVVYATCGENLSALNADNGHELWKLPIFQWEPTPVVLKNGAILSSHAWELVAVDANGNTLWKFPPPNDVAKPRRPGLVVDQPLYSSLIAVGPDDSFYVGSGDGEFSAFSAQGTLKWTYDAGPLKGINFASSPVIASDGTVIAVSTQATVYAFTPDGAVKWNVDLRDPVRNIAHPSPVLGSDGTIYVLCEGKLVALSSAGKTIWELPLPVEAVISPTLAADGTLYLATTDGVLYAVQTASQGLMNSPWPKYQHDASNSGRSQF